MQTAYLAMGDAMQLNKGYPVHFQACQKFASDLCISFRFIWAGALFALHAHFRRPQIYTRMCVYFHMYIHVCIRTHKRLKILKARAYFAVRRSFNAEGFRSARPLFTVRSPAAERKLRKMENGKCMCPLR